MNSTIIEVDIYMQSILLVTGADAEVISYLNKKIKIPKDLLKNDINEQFGGSTLFLNNGLVICWVREECPKPHNIELLHELDHACDNILRNVGIDHVEGTDEVYSYLKSFVQKKVFVELEKFTKKKKKGKTNASVRKTKDKLLVA
jgi:hypothetical protein